MKIAWFSKSVYFKWVTELQRLALREYEHGLSPGEQARKALLQGRIYEMDGALEDWLEARRRTV